MVELLALLPKLVRRFGAEELAAEGGFRAVW
jgi:hypothetical protein